VPERLRKLVQRQHGDRRGIARRRWLSTLLPPGRAGGSQPQNHPPRGQLLRVHGAVKPTYLWADDDECDCIFVGGETQYGQLKQLTLSKHQADEALRAAEYRENQSLNRGDYQGVMGGYW